MNKIRYLITLAATLCLFSAAAQGSITTREAWLDGEYDARQTIPAGQASINIGNLKEGLHSISIQVADNNGTRSPARTMFFIKTAENPATQISTRQAWFDGNYDARQTLNGNNATIDIKKLAPGVHTLTTQVRDNTGKCSPPVTSLFVKNQEGGIASDIAKTIAWIDGDNNRPITLNPRQAVIDITGLTRGIHLLTIQAIDNLGHATPAKSQIFLIPTAETTPPTTIDMCHYWFNDSVRNARFAPLEALSGIALLDISHLRQGTHTLYWQVRDNKGNWSPVVAQTFNLKISEYTLGDIDNDGKVDISDLNILINVMLGKDQASNYGHRCYITDDESIDIADLNLIINTILSK